MAIPVELRANDMVHSGFTSGQVTLSLESVANSFSLEYDESPPDTPAAGESGATTYRDRAGGAASQDPRVIYAGDRCVLTVDGEDLVHGFVDEAKVEYSSDSLSFSVSGRSVTCDLVDCASLVKPSQFTNIKVSALAAKLLEPFGVDVIVAGNEGAALPKFKIEQGETPVDALARAARLRGMVLYTVNDALIIERAGESETTTTLRRGVNVTNGSHTSSWSDRFSPYVYKGQARANDETSGASAHHLRGEVEDPQLAAAGRYRPMLITHSTGQGGAADVAKRARLECNQRMGRGERVSYTVDEYKTDDGFLWRPNLRVFVEDDWLGIQGWLLVVSASYKFGPDEPPGCQLELTRPEAFDEINFPARGRGQLWT